MTNTRTKEVYSEVNSFLNLLLEEDRIKIPLKLRKLINDERLKDYNPQYSFEKPIDEQEISDEALAMIALLHINYWCNDNEEKERINNILKNNEDKYQAELREKYNPDNLFKKQKSEILNLENNTITREFYNICENILNALVECASSKAYYIREYLMKSKKII